MMAADRDDLLPVCAAVCRKRRSTMQCARAGVASIVVPSHPGVYRWKMLNSPSVSPYHGRNV